MKTMPNQIDIKTMDVRHYLTGNGLYAREMVIPRGTLITGKIKKHEHISVISHGFVTEVSNAGVQHIKAPFTMLCYPGTKRIVYAHEESVWVAIHKTTKIVIDDIEEELVAKSYSDCDEEQAKLNNELLRVLR